MNYIDQGLAALLSLSKYASRLLIQTAEACSFCSANGILNHPSFYSHFSSLNFIAFYFIFINCFLFPLGCFYDFTYILLINLTKICFISQLWHLFDLFFIFRLFHLHNLCIECGILLTVDRTWHSIADRT